MSDAENGNYEKKNEKRIKKNIFGEFRLFLLGGFFLLSELIDFEKRKKYIDNVVSECVHRVKR